MESNGNRTSAILVPWALTDWRSAGRHATRTPVEINEQGHQQVADWARVISQSAPQYIYALAKGPSQQTAQELAKYLKIKVRKTDKLDEVNLGLWEGLTPVQLKKRFPKVYKQWRDNPMSICPPEGEELGQAIDRLIGKIHKLATRHEGNCMAVVLGPLAFAALRCHLEDKPYDQMWQMPCDRPVKYWVDLSAEKVLLTS